MNEILMFAGYALAARYFCFCNDDQKSVIKLPISSNRGG